MKRIVEKIETTELCSYGCGCTAKFKNGSDKLMCLASSNSCPANRFKNSLGIKNCGRDYSDNYKNLPQESKDKMNWSKGLTKETNKSVAAASEKLKGRPGISRPHTEETKQKISKKRTEWLKNPENRKIYGRGKKSWMELCFEKWLSENKIEGWTTEQHFWNPILKKNYYVDFLFTDKSLIIELDGNQHKKTIQQDSVRDEYLHTLGYIIVRITHKEFKERYFSDIGFYDILGG
jgi:hypothetical protein